MRVFIAVVTILIVMPHLVYSQSYNLSTDQDFFPRVHKSDENYTMGVGLRYTQPRISMVDQKFVLADITRLSEVYIAMLFRNVNVVTNEADNRLFSDVYSLSCGAFTPANLNTSDIQYYDRPYASVTDFTIGNIDLYIEPRKKPKIFNTEFSLGFLGTGVAPQVQIGIHHIMNNNDTQRPFTPKGWNHQISNGGELTFLYESKVRQLLFSLGPHSLSAKVPQNPDSSLSSKGTRRLIDVSWTREYFVGYYTGFAFSLNTRIGLLDFRNWSFTPNPIAGSVGTLTGGSIKRGYFQTRRKLEVYISSELKPMTMLYNALLQGQFRKSDYVFRGGDVNAFLYQWASAFNLNVPFRKSNLTIAYNFLSVKSPEYRRQDSFGRSHYWGGLYFTYSVYK